VARVFDKLQLGEAAARVGVRTPATILVTAGAPMPTVSPPVIVKERVHAGANDVGGPRIEAAVAATGAEASRCVAAVHAAGSDAVVQEVVAGRLIAHASVTAADGKVVVAVQQEAERIFPRETGVSARAHTVPLDAHVAQAATRVLREVRWSGLAQMQFLHAPGSEPCLIDFNGRLYGSLALAVAAGANLPALWAAVATGRPVEEVPKAIVSIRYQWLEGDLRLATGGRGGELLREVIGCLRYAAGAHHGIWSLSDPLPQVRDGWRLLREEVPNVHRLVRKLRS
jgi:predicted ATP-grasp superfamily ATP-dependent carboligase